MLWAGWGGGCGDRGTHRWIAHSKYFQYCLERASGKTQLTELRKLVVPDQGVAANNLAVGFGKIDYDISGCKVELVLLGLGKLPLLRVSHCDLTKFGTAANDGPILRVVEFRVVHGRAKIELACRLGQLVEGAVGGGGHASWCHQKSGEHSPEGALLVGSHDENVLYRESEI